MAMAIIPALSSHLGSRVGRPGDIGVLYSALSYSFHLGDLVLQNSLMRKW
jgi:hypothetical protein